MLIHRGKILQDAVYKYCEKHGISITRLAKKAGYEQSTIYRHFSNDKLSYNVIIKYGKAMMHDFSEEFPDMMRHFRLEEEAPEKEMPDKGLTNDECMEQLKYYQKKYIELLEKHNQMLINRLTVYENDGNKTTE
jgi:AcrR family transcriptional regulator